MVRHTPAICENSAAVLRLDGLGVFQSPPRKLRESFSRNVTATFLLTETILLTVGGIPDPVAEKINSIQGHKCGAVPFVDRRSVVGQVDCTMAVAERNTCHVPKSEHKAQFFVIHVPSDISGVH